MKTIDSDSEREEDSVRAEGLQKLLDSLDALVYATDMETHELLFFNAYGRERWGDPGGRKCWEVLQTGQDGPCRFCTNPRLLDAEGRPGAAVVWEFENTVNGRWYQCRDQAIEWPDGRMVRVEVATDISALKGLEIKLVEARQRAERLAYTDELTGLYNRRAFFELAAKLIKQGRRLGQSVAVVLFDLDHFKEINDSCGHAAGDEVLKRVADILRELVRESDVACRFGGEEFAIALANVDIERAQQLAERLRGRLSSWPMALGCHSDDCRETVTASFGVVACDAGQADLDLMLSQADHAMYQAKGKGRDRVEAVLHRSS